ncbi:bacteriocin biosynthesis cyclodehydratase [Listeria monocytogenes]|nr:bacteriocin biosynthesis cyclodehydratase [Listeria monocytogenes]
MKTYIIKNGTKIVSTDSEFILKRGVIHKGELVINKEDSSNDFVNAFQELIEKKTISISREHAIYDDFKTLTKFGFLTFAKKELKKPLVIVEDALVEKVASYLGQQSKVISASEFLTSKEIDLLNEDKNILKLSTLIEQKKSILKEFEHIYLLTRMLNLSLLRGFNKLMKLTETINTIAFFDNENVFITCIEHGETGCYECLEQQLMSHFEGVADSYIEQIDMDVSSSELLFALSIAKKEFDNINIYGQSSLLGNIIHFNMNNYEYSFNTNRIQSCCSNCATFNNTLFEEQNIRSVNVLKELMASD